MATATVEALVAAPPVALAIQQAPEIVLAEATKAAKALADVINSRPNKLTINGKTYLQFEDWQTLGRFYGVTVAARTATYVEFGRTQGFEATAEAILVGSDQVISSASAMCLDDESKWSNKPLFQLKSMAQTRACAKALRNVLAWVVVLAGYAPTPAEEMDEAAPQRASSPAKPAGSALSPDRVKEMLGEIKRASNRNQLREIFKQAYSEASKVRDQRAQADYIAAKDARMRELQ
jgi:hypothetical protein